MPTSSDVFALGQSIANFLAKLTNTTLLSEPFFQDRLIRKGLYSLRVTD